MASLFCILPLGDLISIISILIFQIYVLYLTGILLECIICTLVFILHKFIKWYFPYPSLSCSLSQLSKCWHCFSSCSVPKSHFKSPWLLSLSHMSHLDHQEILLFPYSKYLKIQLLPNTSFILFWYKFLCSYLDWFTCLISSFCFNTWPVAVYFHLSSPRNQLKAKLYHLIPFLTLFNIFVVSKWKHKPYKSLQNIVHLVPLVLSPSIVPLSHSTLAMLAALFILQ